MRREECGKDGWPRGHGAASSIGHPETGTGLRVELWGFMTEPTGLLRYQRSSEILNTCLISSRFSKKGIYFFFVSTSWCNPLT